MTTKTKSLNQGDKLTLVDPGPVSGSFGYPMPGDRFDDGRICIGSVIFREADDEVDRDIFTVILLNPSTPFYTVTTLYSNGFHVYEVESEGYDHYNIVHAIEGDEYPNPIPGTHRMQGPRAWGYTDLGGDA